MQRKCDSDQRSGLGGQIRVGKCRITGGNNMRNETDRTQRTVCTTVLTVRMVITCRFLRTTAIELRNSLAYTAAGRCYRRCGKGKHSLPGQPDQTQGQQQGQE